jgi:hypothetical protein
MREHGNLLRSLPDVEFDMAKMVATFCPDEDDGKVHTLALKWEVCGTCGGVGKHVNPSVDSHGISSEEFAEDPDFKENYFGGVYDVTCYGCEGRTTALAIDEGVTDKDALKAAEAHFKEEGQYRSQCNYERMMGY